MKQRVLSMEGTTAERQDTDSQERPAGQAWVIVDRARRGIQKWVNSLSYVSWLPEETQGHGALTDSKLNAWGWGVLCSKPRKSKGINCCFVLSGGWG